MGFLINTRSQKGGSRMTKKTGIRTSSTRTDTPIISNRPVPNVTAANSTENSEVVNSQSMLSADESMYSTSQATNDNSRRITSFDESVPESQVEDNKGPISFRERVKAARKSRKGVSELSDMQYLVEEGPLSFRAFAFAGGFFMVLAAILDYIEVIKDDDSSPLSTLITVQMLIFGFITMTVEGRPFEVQIGWLYYAIVRSFNFFRYVWGRGFYYFVIGCVQFFLFTKYNMISGGYHMLLGVVCLVVGYNASLKLAALRNSIQTKSDINYVFQAFDRDRDGFLNVEEFRELMRALDQDVDYNDFVAALSAIDQDQNQKVSYYDLEKWWESYNDEELPPGSNLCGKLQRGRSKSVKRVHSTNSTASTPFMA